MFHLSNFQSEARLFMLTLEPTRKYKSIHLLGIRQFVEKEILRSTIFGHSLRESFGSLSRQKILPIAEWVSPLPPKREGEKRRKNRQGTG